MAVAGSDLENAPVMRVVMRDHVEDEDALDSHPGEVDGPGVGKLHRECSLNEALCQVTGAETVGGELLTRQMDEPDVAVKLAGAAQFQQTGGTQEQCRGGRAVVV